MRIPDIETYDDGRRPIKELYNQFLKLQDEGWIYEKIYTSKGIWQGKQISLPIISFRTKKEGRAFWVLSGVHGEEPAGPNAMAEGIEYVRELGKKHSVVFIPLCNPLGYVRDWRYTDMARLSMEVEGKSVGDSEHWLLDLKNPKVPRRKKPSCLESKALTAYIVKLCKDYPPIMSIDFHEDAYLNMGYVYSQGEKAEKDPIARRVVKVLFDNGIPMKMNGKDVFGHEIYDGVIGAEKDSSMDELLATEKIYYLGKVVRKNYAQTAIVVETPVLTMPLEARAKAHLEVLKSLKDFV